MLLYVSNRCKTLWAFVRRIEHPVGCSWRRGQVRCSWHTDKRVFRTWNGSSQVWSGGQNLLKSGSAWLQSLRRQPHSSCLACWQATAGFLKERPWGISSASYQSHGINAEADGVNGGGQASQRAGSVQTLVNLPLITSVFKMNMKCSTLGASIASPQIQPWLFPRLVHFHPASGVDTFQCSPTADQKILL